MSIDAPNNKADKYGSHAKQATRTDSSSSNASGSTHTSSATTKPATSLDSINIKVGQAIQAKVIEVLNSVSTRSNQNNFNVTLEIGGEKLAVKTNIALQPGQVIELSANAKGELLLPRPTQADTPPLISALSKVLPYQQPIGKVIALLMQNLPALTSGNAEVKQLADQLTALLPKSANFTGNTNGSTSPSGSVVNGAQLVKQAISQSGIFMESKLALAGQQSALVNSSRSQINSSSISSATHALAQALKSVAQAPSSTTSATGTSTNNLAALNAGTVSSTPLTTDLKSTISQLIGSLNAIYATQHSATGQTPNFIAESDPALLVNPFNFPSALSTSKLGLQGDRDLSVGDLLKRLAGALNRIQFQQLNSLYQAQSASTDTTTIQTWQMELPFLSQQNQIDSIQLRIDQEKEKNDDQEGAEKTSKWKLALTFDLEELGPMFIQVNLTPPTISSTIWAENQATLKLINKEAHNLRESFAELGLTVEDISCRKGQPNMRKTRLDQQIVDIKA